jgi:hypothetical protein
MKPAACRYRIEVLDPRGEWVTWIQDDSLQYLRGTLDADGRRGGPRLAERLVRARDGHVVAEICALTEVSLGAGAGLPTPEQYESAAEQALAKARRLREMAARAVRRGEP